ncbi:unnamed protein product [Citrullus colocynthis]|uniref:Uncharacterized protein n=1 Tax=Citrullus colocynthis TaxID=252529 RepID=A0ABP0Y1A0_9ROSI
MCKGRCGSDWRQTKAATVDRGKRQRRREWWSVVDDIDLKRMYAYVHEAQWWNLEYPLDEKKRRNGISIEILVKSGESHVRIKASQSLLPRSRIFDKRLVHFQATDIVATLSEKLSPIILSSNTKN